MAAILSALCVRADLPFTAAGMVVASVVPAMNAIWSHLARDWFGIEALFLEEGERYGIAVRYDPPRAVGADRLANAIAAVRLATPPIVVVDFGTATTFDAIGPGPSYLGGAILPGIQVSADALSRNTAKLPQIELTAPGHAIGTNTTEAMQSGLMLGYAGAIESLIARFRAELGGGVVIGTGGLADKFRALCPSIERFEPNLTIDGLRLAWEAIRAPNPSS
jgi:type III pantothenate kinase